MPLDIDALRLRVPDAFSDEPPDEIRLGDPDIPEREPVRIWNPATDTLRLHPVDAISWTLDGDEALKAGIERLVTVERPGDRVDGV